jgi:6-phosphogluconolactonase
MIPVYVGTYTDGESRGIYRFELDGAGARMSAPELVAEAVNPSFLAWHPSRDVVYAVSETDDVGPERTGALLAFSVGDSRLTLINQVSSGGAGPCHVSVNASGTHAFVANYGAGSVAAFPLLSDGSLATASSIVQHRGSGAHPTRQTRAHAHSIRPAPEGSFVLAADLGIDRVLVYRFEAVTGTLAPHLPPATPTRPGAGPRHLAPHPSADTVFVMNELSSTLAWYAWDRTRGTLDPLGEVSTLPEEFTGENTTAEVVVHPSGRFVYGSNRGHDSIAVFRIGDGGALARVGIYSTGGRTPRHFALDPGGAFLLAANQESNSIVLLHVDQKTGALTDSGARVDAPSPVFVGCAPRQSSRASRSPAGAHAIRENAFRSVDVESSEGRAGASNGRWSIVSNVTNQ